MQVLSADWDADFSFEHMQYECMLAVGLVVPQLRMIVSIQCNQYVSGWRLVGIWTYHRSEIEGEQLNVLTSASRR